jgi:hypothetical protein
MSMSLIWNMHHTLHSTWFVHLQDLDISYGMGHSTENPQVMHEIAWNFFAY